MNRARNVFSLQTMWNELTPLDLRFVGRTLLHTALVGLAGVVHAIAPGWTCELDEEANLLWSRS